MERDDRSLSPSLRTTALLALLLGLARPVSPAQGDDPRARLSAAFDREIRPFVSAYCIECHAGPKAEAELDLAAFATAAQAFAKPHVWKDCAGRVQDQQDMPPRKAAKKPTPAERARFAAWVADFKHLSPKDPGRGTIRRLSQVEYANTLADLLGVDRAIADAVPKDVVGEGFNSSIPPLLMEQYLAVADAALEEIIAPEQLKAKWSGGQMAALIDGKPSPGAAEGAERTIVGPGEVSVDFTAPVEGTYTLRLKAGAERAPGREPCRVALRINGEPVGEVKVTAFAKYPGTYTVTFKLSPGRATVSAATANPFVDPPPPRPAPRGASPAPVVPVQPVPRTLVVESLEVLGPPGGRQTPQQRKLFTAQPGKGLTPREAARKILEPFARRAFRRPPREEELAGLLKVFDLADGKALGFSESVRLMLKAVLVSPSFLFLTPDDGTIQGPDGAIVPLGDHQLASRLSYLFWSTMPDDELSSLADAGKLRDPAVLAAQARRLIADPRSRALFDGFGAAWLGLDRIEEHEIDETKFPELTPALRRSMVEEAALLFGAILRENRPLTEFIDANYTFVDDALAKVYGLGAPGRGMTRVALTDRNRGGVLTMPGVLAVTSLPNRTSPVKRGRWVLEQILGQTPPSPPADVPALEKQDTPAAAKLNLRARMEQHRSNPACFGCHQAIDPLGFGLENFDVLGRWRTKDDTGVPVDAKGELPGDVAFDGPAELRKILAGRKDEFCLNLARRALAYTLCRSLHGYDLVVADEIAAEAARGGYRFQDLWVRVATSYPFLHRKISR